MPLPTLGDAAASFLKRPDTSTCGMSLADRENIDNMWMDKRPMVWQPKKKRWHAAVSAKAWIFTIATYV
jgi:hypothetical protein